MAVEVWPENWQAWSLFFDMRTQWRMSGMGGPTGLDYTALVAVMDLRGVPADDRPQLFADLQVMETAALAQITKTST